MSIDEIKDLTLDEVQKRMTEIPAELDAEGADIEALDAEADALISRKKEIENAVEQRKSIMHKVADGKIGKVIESEDMEERSMEKTEKEIRSSQEYAVAYANYIKTGSDAECRAVLTDITDTTGGVPVPTILEGAIENAWEKAQLVNKARKVSVKGTLNVPYEDSADDAAVHTEGAAANAEESLVIKKLSIVPESLMKWITVSGEVMALNGVDFLNYIAAEITQKIAELADSRLVEKVIASDFTQTITGTTSWTSLLAAQALLSSNANDPVLICTKNDFFTGFMAAEDTTGRPIYSIISENGKPVYMVNGLQAVFTEALTDGSYIVGDMDGALVNLPDGENVNYTIDPYSLAEQDLTKIVGKLYAGIDVTKMKHFVYVTAAAE